jgi:uncharacterized membrane protein
MNSTLRYGLGLTIAAAAGVASVLAAPDLPREVVTHWNAAGEPDGYAPRWVAMALLPALSIAMLAMFAVIPRIDPLGENIREFQAAYEWLAAGTVALLAYVHGVLLLINVGVEASIFQLVTPAIAALYIVVGIVLDRAEQNWFVGIRTPWTLSDEAVWDRTHQRAAPLFVVAGILALGALVVPEYAAALLVGPVAVVALATTVYSYVAYRQLHHS